MLLAIEEHLHADRRMIGFADLGIDQHELNPRKKMPFVVWLDDEIVGPALQSMNHILWVSQRRQQNHRHVFQVRIGLDLPAKLVAVHFRHQYIADQERRLVCSRRIDRLPPVDRDGRAVAMTLQRMLQQLGLGWAVLGNQDIHGIFSVGNHFSLLPRAVNVN